MDACDLFLSYNSADREIILAIQHSLRQAGIRSFLDQHDLQPGLPWMDELERALDTVHAVAVFIGANGLGRHQKREMQYALRRQAAEEGAGRTFPVIPVLLTGGHEHDISGFIVLNTWVDLRGVADANSLAKAFRTLVDRSPESTDQGPRPPQCPYKGLDAFREQDTRLFFGRDKYSKRLFDAVLEAPVVVLLGDSGSGKSSLLQAGLMPSLRMLRGRTGLYEPLLLSPGSRPFYRLALQFVVLWSSPQRTQTQLIAESEELAQLFADEKVSLGHCVDRFMQMSPGTECLVLVIDQFEELFTLVPDITVQEGVIRLLLSGGHPRLRLVVALRADFYGIALRTSRLLSDGIADGKIINLPSIGGDEIVDIIERPATLTQWSFEPGLVARIKQDVEEQPGCLPLLEFALTELWNRSTAQRMFRHVDYDAVGRVSGAISRRADAVLESVDRNNRELALATLCRLVHVSSGGPEGRVSREIVRLDALDQRAVLAIQPFADARLLVLSAHDNSVGTTVTVAHEALFTGWAALRAWIERDRTFLYWRQQLRFFLDGWHGASKSPSALLAGIYLDQAKAWLTERGDDLSQNESAFIQVSADVGARAEAERLRNENLAQASARRSERIRRTTRIVLSVFILLAAAFFVFAMWQRTDRYQIDRISSRAPRLQAEADDAALEDWIQASAIAGRTSEIIRGDSDPDTYRRSALVSNVAVDLAGRGFVEPALKLVQSINDATARARTLVEISQTLSGGRENQMVQSALEKARDAEDSESRILKVLEMLEDGQWTGSADDVLAASQSQTDTARQAVLLARGAELIATSGRVPEANILIDLARSRVQQISDLDSRLVAETSIGQALIKAGRPSDAISIANSARFVWGICG